MPKPAYKHTTSEAFWDTPIYMQSTTKLEQTGSTSDLCTASQCVQHPNVLYCDIIIIIIIIIIIVIIIIK